MLREAHFEHFKRALVVDLVIIHHVCGKLIEPDAINLRRDWHTFDNIPLAVLEEILRPLLLLVAAGADAWRAAADLAFDPPRVIDVEGAVDRVVRLRRDVQPKHTEDA